jgi:uncharacterized protein DUF3616
VDDPDGEADVEGLAADDQWLWLLGSHARTRAKPEKAKGGIIDTDALADLKNTRALCLLARFPLAERDGGVSPFAATARAEPACSSRTSRATHSPRR